MTPVVPTSGRRTEIPGPRSRDLLARQDRRESAARSYPRRLPIALVRGAGSFVEDADGNVFIDFLAGAGALALGHGHPELVAAVRAQVGVLAHALDFPTPAKDEFTTRLLDILPAPMRADTRLHFCGPTGANAVEAAIKLCKTATGRAEIVAFQGGFHGMTHGALAASAESGLRARVGGLAAGVHFLPFAYCHRCPLGLRRQTCETNCAGYVERALTGTHTGIGRPAAVLLELVQGEGGTVVAPPDFVRRVREVTARLDIPLIVDEVQTGCGRTGRWFAFEHYDIEPDVVVLSKMLSGVGMPAAVIAYHRRLDTWAPGAHTGTFRGNQVAFAAGSAFLDVMVRDGVLANVRARGAQALAGLERLRGRHSGLVTDVRGLGLMLGVEFRDGAAATRVQRAALDRGLIVEVGGYDDAVVRMLPPLNVDESTMDSALAILATAIDQVGSDCAATLRS
ncbi:aspartate aminotransferase family protein [Actinokineospora sp.]|uniref:aspartate aminotransferase family protein n=1 Tax=Actinokineospora sp. TaxID=1872133 RepID=UPI004037E083